MSRQQAMVQGVTAADLYHDLQPATRVRLRDNLPGLAVTLAATLAAGFISDHYGAPLTLMALLIGLAFNFLNADAQAARTGAAESNPYSADGDISKEHLLHTPKNGFGSSK